jgi:hypothetical protein
VRLLIAFFLLVSLSVNGQWTVVPSGTDSALYCVTYHNGDYLIGGASSTLLHAESDQMIFTDAIDEYTVNPSFNPDFVYPITKIGVYNDTTLFTHYNSPLHDVADSNVVYTYWAGVSVGIDSNLVIISEERVELVVDTSEIDYWLDPWLVEEGELADIGTIAWILRSLDGTSTFDLGTVFNTQIYTNSSHTSGAQFVGCIDYYSNLLFSTDSARTFSTYELPGVPYSWDEEDFVYDDFRAAAFYFEQDIVGFYGPAAEASSSLYRIDLTNGNYTSMEISPEYHWNRITMVGSQFVIAVGDSGMVASSFDLGETWMVENIGTELDLYGVDADEEGNLIIVGDSGLIMTNTIPPVEGIEISSEDDLNAIETESGTLQLSASVIPDSAPQEVSWSMVNLSGTATIDQNGLVTAQGNGVVMAVASIAEPPGITGFSETKTLAVPTATFFILISGQELDEQYIFGADTTICGSDIFTVNLPDSPNEIEWSDGSSESSFEISQFGTYWVTVTNGDFVRSDTIWVFQFPYPEFSLGEDTTACTGEEITLEAPWFFENYEWSTGSDETSITVSESGVYSLGITMNNCTGYDEVEVAFLGVGDFDLGDDVAICDGHTTTISAPLEGNYSWSDGSEDSDVSIGEEGWVVLEITEGECSNKDSLFVTIDPVPEFNLGADTTICDTASLLLDAFVSGGFYEWSTGSNESFLEVSEEGIYGVTVSLGNCSVEDSIEVSIQNCALSVSEVLARKTKVYPNPADEFIVIEIPADLIGAQVSLYSTDGKKIFTRKQNSKRESHLFNRVSEGTYILVLELGEIRFSKEIIKH